MISKTMSVALILAAAVGATAAPAAAATMTTTGTIQVWVTPSRHTNSAVAKIVITGVIGDYGTATTINKNGTVNDNGNYVKIVLQHGGFEVNSVALNKDQQCPAHYVKRHDMLGRVRWLRADYAVQRHRHVRRDHRHYPGDRKVRRYRPQVHQRGQKGPVQHEQQRQPLAFYGSITGTGKVSFG